MRCPDTSGKRCDASMVIDCSLSLNCEVQTNIEPCLMTLLFVLTKYQFLANSSCDNICRLAFPEENNKSLRKIPKLEDPSQYSKLGLVVRLFNH